MQKKNITRIFAALFGAILFAGCLEVDNGDDINSVDTETATASELDNGTDSETAIDSSTVDTGIDSNTEVKGCKYHGETFDIGDVINSVAGTNCGDCRCEVDGTVSCVDTECVPMCVYGGTGYGVGESFPADDGCNTCSCSAAGDVACTKMACMPKNCDDQPEKEYFEPGCGEEEGGPVITAGCYQSCDGVPCAEGICQSTDINPCVCEPGMACCDACGSREYLCLEAPSECGGVSAQFAITGGGKSFGSCIGECQFTVSIQPGNANVCAGATLEVCGTRTNGCTRTNIGHLTPTGNALLTGLAVELVGQNLQEVYGCPDCVDGGASQIALVMDSVQQTISYEFNNPPDMLKQADAFTASVINALNTCTSNENIVVSNSCTVAEQ